MSGKPNNFLIIKIIMLNIVCILIAIIFAFENGLLRHKKYSQLKCALRIVNCYIPTPQNNTKGAMPPSAEQIKQTDIMPTKIAYGPLGINLDIISMSYDNNIHSWGVDKNKANIMAEQAQLFPASGKGQTFIYAHNTNNIFYFVNLLQIGDIVDLFDANGNHYGFEVTTTETVLPTSSDILKYDGDYRLVLMTCTSFNDKDRKLVYLKPITTN